MISDLRGKNKNVLKIWSKFTGEHPCGSVISIKLLCKFTEIILRHWCFNVNLLHIFRTSLQDGKKFDVSSIEKWRHHLLFGKKKVFISNPHILISKFWLSWELYCISLDFHQNSSTTLELKKMKDWRDLVEGLAFNVSF